MASGEGLSESDKRTAYSCDRAPVYQVISVLCAAAADLS